MLRSGAPGAQAPRQAIGSVGPTIFECSTRGRQCGEQRLGEPFGKECFDADVLDVIGELRVTAPTGFSLVDVGDSGGGSDQDETTNPCRLANRCVQGESPAHRVAHQDRVRKLVDELIGGGRQVGAHLAG